MKIDKGIPIPVSNRRRAVAKLVKKMKVGDSVALTFSQVTAFRDNARQLGIKIMVRRQPDFTYRAWKMPGDIDDDKE